MNASHLLTRITLTLALCACVLGVTTTAAAQGLPPELEGVDIIEHLGDRVDRNLRFTDHTGRDVTLGEYFSDGIPVILTLNYYSCPMLCSLQLNGLIDGLQGLPWRAGETFRIVTVSIDPEEDATLAQAKRDTYLEALGQGDVDWSFLTGDESQIRELAAQVGFGYRYVREVEEYAHAAAIFLLSPDGVITRYLYGVQYRAFDLRMAVLEAGEGRVGSTVDRFILSCFHYDPDRNSYAIFAFGVMRVGGVITVLLLGLVLGLLWFRDLRRRLSGTLET